MYEAIASNRRNSILLVLAIAAILALVGYTLGEALAPAGGVAGALLGTLVAALSGLFAWLGGGSLFLATAGARRIRDGELPNLRNVVEEMAIAAGVPAPGIYVIDHDAPNAFATGRSPSNCAVAVTRGLLESLDRDELQGVVAHEMGHIVNRDILFMTVAGVLVGAIATVGAVAEGFARGAAFRGGGRRSRRERNSAMLLVLLALGIGLVARPLARLLYLAASRQREYLADATAARLTRHPEGLARALERIAADPGELRLGEATAAMCIVNPLQDDGTAERFLGGLFSTHPPTERRVAVLRGMAGSDYKAYDRAYAAINRRSVIPKQALAGTD